MSQARSGYRQSISGLVGAVAACLALIAVIWGLSRIQGGEDVDPSPTVDIAPELAVARDTSSFDVLTPESVPAGWRATSVNWQVRGPVQTWELGYLSEDEEFIGLEQSNAVVDDVVESATPADRPGEPVTIEGEDWQTLTSSGGETALVSVDGDVTVVVTGTVDQEELTTFAASLRAS